MPPPSSPMSAWQIRDYSADADRRFARFSSRDIRRETFNLLPFGRNSFARALSLVELRTFINSVNDCDVDLRHTFADTTVPTAISLTSTYNIYYIILWLTSRNGCSWGYIITCFQRACKVGAVVAWSLLCRCWFIVITVKLRVPTCHDSQPCIHRSRSRVHAPNCIVWVHFEFFNGPMQTAYHQWTLTYKEEAHCKYVCRVRTFKFFFARMTVNLHLFYSNSVVLSVDFDRRRWASCSALVRRRARVLILRTHGTIYGIDNVVG